MNRPEIDPTTGIRIVEPIWDRKQTAEYLRISPRRLNEFREQGRIPPPDFYVGRGPRWYAPTIEDYLAVMGRI